MSTIEQLQRTNCQRAGADSQPTLTSARAYAWTRPSRTLDWT